MINCKVMPIDGSKEVWRCYEKVEGSKMLATVCDKTGLKVGSVICERDCVFFREIDYEGQAVRCTSK